MITRISAGRASFCDQFIRVSWLLLLASMAVASANPVTGTKIDLNAFDGLKKTVALPNGETLAYVSMGDPGR